MKIGLFQYNISWENKAENKKKILSILGDSDLKDIDWIIFPEMTLSGFSMDLTKTTTNDDDMNFFKKLSSSYKCSISFGGVIDANNRNITINKHGEMLSQYSKIHLFGYGDEHNHYKPGKEPVSFEIGGFIACPLVCYDLRFSYMFWDQAIKTNLYYVIASWPASRREHWMTLLKARAIENQSYVIGVNRCGNDPKLSYAGDSVVIDPLGKELINCTDKEGLYTVEINMEELLMIRKTFPFIKDRLK